MESPLLGGEPGSEEEETIELKYTFTGKLTLFPLFLICMFVAAATLLTRGTRPYNAGYFTSSEVWFGIAGVATFVAGIGCLVAIAAFVVFRITLRVTPHSLVVVKSGVFRSSRLVFDRSDLSLHYLRTHYTDDAAWIKLVVRENETYYILASWKGAGDQKARFFELFAALSTALRTAPGPLPSPGGRDTELISRNESTLITPFASRLRSLAAASAPLRRETDMFTSASSATCIQDLPFVVDCDRFTRQFIPKPDLVPRTT